MKRKLLTIGLFTALLILLAGCYTPSPLYGTWKDNNGNEIKFFDDFTFSSKIVDSDETTINYDGTYSVVDNVLIFTISGERAANRITEWDIRGAILYLDWTIGNNTKKLTLYHTGR